MKNQAHKRTRERIGWLCLGIGLYVSSISTGLLPIKIDNLHAPLWVLFLCGVIFILCGVMMLIGHGSKFNNILAAIVLIIMAGIGGWIALFSTPEAISGGIPFLSETNNIILSRIVFGCGALLTFFMSMYAIRKYIKNNA